MTQRIIEHTARAFRCRKHSVRCPDEIVWRVE